MTSNTFSLPSSALSIALARLDWNNSLLALADNFYGPSEPVAANYSIEGVDTTVPDGLLFRSSTTNALYIVDSAAQKGNPVHGGNYTRVGIGFRVEGTLAAADFSTYEIGEAFATIGVSAANTRMYLKSDNSGGIIDIGIPYDGTVTTSKIADAAVTSDKLAPGAAGAGTFLVNSETSTGSNVFALSEGANPPSPVSVAVWADGVYQANSHWVLATDNSYIQFTDATVISGIEIVTQVLA